MELLLIDLIDSRYGSHFDFYRFERICDAQGANTWASHNSCLKQYNSKRPLYLQKRLFLGRGEVGG